MIDLLPPKVNVSINVKIRLNILAGVLDELTKICGVSIESTLKKGIVDRDVIENIYVSFCDKPDHICGQNIFEINWDRFEFLAKTDEGKVLYSNLDTSKSISMQLDKRLRDAVEVYVRRIKRKYNVREVECTFSYRNKYTQTEEIHDAARSYMGHVKNTGNKKIEKNQNFENEVKAAFQGLDGLLDITFKS